MQQRKDAAALTRREALGLGIMGTAAWGLGQTGAALAAPQGPMDRAAPKNIIFLVSDGMSAGVPSLAEPFAQLVRGKGTVWPKLMNDPQAAIGFFESHSLNSLVTDSAAAASAWASGSRVFNGALNVLPDGTKLTPIAPLVRDSGRRVGLVTTTQLTHATPAGFAAVQASRDEHLEIGPQYLDVVDVLMGGGIEYFDPKLRSDERDLIGEFKQAGYAFWDHRSQVSAGPEKILGLFGEGHLPYTLDWNNRSEISEKVPTLAEMTRVALSTLARPSGGFLLQVEGGRVDHAAHANDAPSILWDQLAFDDAVAVALEFAANRDDTLVIVTTDHGNANPGLNGMGSRYSSSNECFERLAKATSSFERLAPELKKHTADGATLTTDTVVELVRAAEGIELTRKEADAVRGVLSGDKPFELSHQLDSAVGILGQALGNHNGVGWTGTTHTADHCWITATGPGREHFHGMLKNTDAFDRIARLWGIQHQNPALTPAAAKKFAGVPVRPEAFNEFVTV